nr:MAG TPA: hypothetical protein [Caudoviricetes sp.]
MNIINAGLSRLPSFGFVKTLTLVQAHKVSS